MSKWWSRILWAFVFIYFAGMLVIWLIPVRDNPNDVPSEELRVVQERVLSARDALTEVKLDKAVVKPNKVVAVFVTWKGRQPYSLRDRQNWNREARKVALLIASQYVPEDWHVNVALYYKKLPRGMYGISAQQARMDAAQNLPEDQ